MCITKIQKTFPVGRIIEKNFTLRLSNGFDSCLLISNHVSIVTEAWTLAIPLQIFQCPGLCVVGFAGQ